MVSVTIDEIQRDPLKYFQQVEAGETLIIMRAVIPIAELRPFGLCAGEFMVPADFDALPEDIL
ncbi:type II toxin-antitoxin system Phd/YefM family antitoxin [Leptolyngbya sp. NIES-2104]|uniref:type II toxin-antitoxin system Phd/YefM family antitoxin n=1 Tax=Leptolyngbya sp. NIES-2104 TaxID=1552121 RepID=UPI0006EC6987|nr:hypothetical protein [Leptolyngbya sp. NIES-2104]GAP95821.1 RelB/StbD replicon stabilization protein [Leptolyngbya sp. NIES-2104]